MSKNPDYSDSELDLKASIEYETLKTLSANGASSFLISIINALIVFATLRSVESESVLSIWLGAIVLISILRSIMVGIFQRLKKDLKKLRRWLRVYLIFIYASGICWGILPLLGVFYLAPWTETFIVFIIAGMSAGGLISLYPSLLAAIPYHVLMLGPLIFVLSSSGAPAHSAMALLASLYLILLVRSTFTLNRSATDTISLEMENNELFKFLLKVRK